jgi:hypothetical protein
MLGLDMRLKLNRTETKSLRLFMIGAAIIALSGFPPLLWINTALGFSVSAIAGLIVGLYGFVLWLIGICGGNSDDCED